MAMFSKAEVTTVVQPSSSGFSQDAMELHSLEATAPEVLESSPRAHCCDTSVVAIVSGQ